MIRCRKLLKSLWHFLFLFTLLFISCRGQEQRVDIEHVTIRMAIPGYQQPLYEELAKIFAETNSDVNIQLVLKEEILEWQGSGGVFTASTDDDLVLAREADVFIPLSPLIAAENGALLTLSPFIVEEQEFSPEDFYPGLLEQFKWQGDIWAIPLEGNYELIFFNKSLFDAANAAYPQPGWSWDDFLATALTLTKRDANLTTQWGFIESFSRSLHFVQSRSGALIELEAEPPIARINNPAVAEIVRWYADLFRVYQVTEIFDQREADQLIRNGRVAMWSSSSGLWYTYPSNLALGAVPFPVDSPDDKTTPISFAPALSISAGTTQPQAAWRWVSFLSRQAPIHSSFVNSSAIPARRSVAAATNFWAQVNEELRPALEYAVEHAFIPLPVRGFEQNVKAFIANEQSLDETLTQAQAQAEEWLAEQQETEPVTTIIMSPIEEGQGRKEEAEITFMVSDTSRMQIYRALAEAFQTTNLDASVKISAVDLARGQTSFEEMAANADCFQSYPLFDASSVQTVLSLEPFFDVDFSQNRDDFFPQALNAFTYETQLRGLPGEISITVIEYNRNLFDAAHIAYPTIDWTLNTFLNKALALTEDSSDGMQYGFVPDLFEPASLVDFLALSGTQLVNTDVNPPALNFIHPSVISMVRWYVNLTEQYGVKPQLLASPEEDVMTVYEMREALINDAHVAMWSDSGGFAGGVSVAVSGISAERPDSVGIAPLPSGLDGVFFGSYRTTSGYFISAQSQAAEICWDWLIFLSQQPDIAEGLPARRSVAESTAYQQAIGEERSAAYLATIERASSSSLFELFSQYLWLEAGLPWLADAYGEIVRNGLSVEAALEQAQQKGTAHHDCLTNQNGFQDLKVIQACFAEVGSP
jgi:ABC-type glycerol-3-phosphate transport system substrate-binding protein